MDSSGQYFHIRVFRPAVYDPSFVLFTKAHSAEHLITREGGGYSKLKHKFIRPHVHILLATFFTHVKLRDLFKKSFPSIAGNKDYSIHVMKKRSLLSYILKDNKIIHKSSGFSDQMLKDVPPWETKTKHFRGKLFAHISSKVAEHNKLRQSNLFYRPYGYDNFLRTTLRFCKEEDQWLPRSLILRYAYILNFMSAECYIEKLKV